jgi:hypothetical protein
MFVLVVLAHYGRRVIHFNVTEQSHRDVDRATDY